MKTKLASGFILVAAIGFAGPALAHEMDLDQDGLYSYAEMLTEYSDLTQEDYDALDTNTDGAVDAEELAAAIDSGALPAME